MNVETNVNASSVFFSYLAHHDHSAFIASFQSNVLKICCVVFLSIKLPRCQHLLRFVDLRKINKDLKVFFYCTALVNKNTALYEV